MFVLFNDFAIQADLFDAMSSFIGNEDCDGNIPIVVMAGGDLFLTELSCDDISECLSGSNYRIPADSLPSGTVFGNMDVGFSVKEFTNEFHSGTARFLDYQLFCENVVPMIKELSGSTSNRDLLAGFMDVLDAYGPLANVEYSSYWDNLLENETGTN